MQQIYIESYYRSGYTRFMNYISNIKYLPQKEQLKIKQKIRVLNFFDEYGIEATTSAFGTKRSTVYLWKQKLKREDGRLSALREESKIPKTTRRRETKAEIIKFIEKYRLKHPGADKVTLKPLVDAFCHSLGLTVISESTVGRVIADLKKQGKLPDYYIRTTVNGKTGNLKYKKRGKGKTKLRRKGYQPKEPGDLVQIDAIEIFLLGISRYIVTAIDLKSRFAFAYTYKSLSSNTARDFMMKLIEVAPFEVRRVQTDNGKEFHKHFRDYLITEGITHFYNYPRSPKSNAFIERFNRTIQEQYVGWHLEDILEPAEFNVGLMEYLVWYNTEKIHRGIGKVAPLKYYIDNFIPTNQSNMLWTVTRTIKTD